MSTVCFICHTKPPACEIGSYGNNAYLVSGKTLRQVLTEILGDNALKTGFDTTELCNSCCLKCVQYHGLSARLNELKSTLQTAFLSQSPSKAETKKSPVALRLPASKLRPLSCQYVFLNKSELNTGKRTTPVKQRSKPIALAPKPPATTKSPTTTAKTTATTIATNPQMKQLTIDASLISKLSEAKSTLTDEMAEESPNLGTLASLKLEPTQTTNLPAASLKLNEKTTAMLNFGINNLPKDFLDTAVLTKTSGEDCVEVDVENNDAQSMEIDEDCMFPAGQSTGEEDTSKKLDRGSPSPDQSASSQNFFEVDILSDPDRSHDEHYVVKKVEIREDGEDAVEDEEDTSEHALLVEGEDGSLIRVMAGQKFVYGDDEISLIIPGDEDGQENNDNADSNDESQIELQVSGDEETANAIIAAAREQGGAFIKVQSGEMYRVKSVKSKMKDDSKAGTAGDPEKKYSNLIKKVGGAYKCLVCARASTKKGDGNPNRSHLSRDGIARHLLNSHGIDVPADKLVTSASVACSSPQPGKKGGHQCLECHRSYGSRNLLREHMNQHTGTRPYSCAACGKTFASKYTHQAHLKTHQDRPRPFKCTKDGCGKCFLTQQNLSQHELTHAGVKQFVCQTCGKAFGTAHNLEVHGVVHSGVKPFQCSICRKSFARKAEIRDHVRTHTGERPFACEICGATFSQRSNLQSHVRATHNQDKRHACTQCEKRFKRRRLLEYHVKSCHTGERPFKCGVCSATFVYPEHYKKHALIHSGERPFVCEVCGKSFNSRDNRNAHRFVHSDKKPYECLVCGAGYMRKPLLYAHMNSSGHMTESIVVNQPRVSSDEPAEVLYEAVGEADLNLGDIKITDSQEVITKVYISTGDKKLTTDKPSENRQDTDSRIITLAQNLEGESYKIEPSILETLANEELGKGAEIVAKDENGSVVRLVQIELPNGENGWIAIN